MSAEYEAARAHAIAVQAMYSAPADVSPEEAAADVWAALERLIAAVPDWRVLGGLVPGVVHAEWLRDGDRIRVNTMEGVVHEHTVDRRDGLAHFVFVTDTGQVRVTRSLDSEIRVTAAAGMGGGR